MRIMITGANGFLGTKIAQRLAGEGHEVIAMVRRLKEYPGLQHENIKLMKGDVVDSNSLAAALVGVNHVYHLAAIANDWAKDFRDIYRTNVEGTINVLDESANAGVEKIVVTSTAGTIGPPDPENIYPVNEKHVRLVDFFTDYESSKCMAEERIAQYASKGQHIVMVNPTRVYGPGPLTRNNGYLLLIHNYMYKPVCFFPGFPQQTGNVVHIDDIVDGHLLAMEKGVSGEKYLLGGSNVSFVDLFKALEKLTGKRAKKFAIPVWILKTIANIHGVRAKWFKLQPLITHAWLEKTKYFWPVSTEKARKELGYSPRSFEVGLAETIAWVKAQKEKGLL